MSKKSLTKSWKNKLTIYAACQTRKSSHINRLFLCIFSLPQGFFTDKDEINERVTIDIRDLCDSFELQAVAIWVTDKITEVYFCETDPCDETLVRIENLSQSFMG